MTLDLAIMIASVAINATLGLFVLRHRPQTASSRLFLIMIAVIIVWSYANFRIDTSPTDAAALAWMKVFYAAAIGIIALFLEFAHRFPFSRRSVLTALLPFARAGALAIIAVTMLTDLVFVSATLGPHGLASLAFGPLYLPFSVAALVGIMGAITELVLKRRKSLLPARDQISFVVFGWSTFLALVVIVGAILPFFIPVLVNLSKLIPLLSVAMVGATAYTIVRHNFLDIRIVLKRSLVYLVTLALVLGVYGLLVTLMDAAHGPSIEAVYLSAGITLLAGIAGFPVLERILSRLVDPIFFRDSYDYAAAIHALSTILYTHIELDDLIAASERRLAEFLHAEFVRITLQSRAPDQPHGATSFLGCGTLSIPISLNDEEIGVIVVGKKRTGDPYERRDIQLLETFAYQAATAFSRARLYAKAREHAHELERTVEERTRELREAQANERRMLVDLSHNLQTPLAVFQARLEQLAHTKLASEDAHSLAQPVQRLSGFIYDLLSLAKLESEKPDVHEGIDLSGLVDEIAEELTVIAGSKGVAIETAIAPGLRITGNERLLREAILNVASNALKYLSETGERRISFALAPKGQMAHLAVADTGRGISGDDLPHVFERFYRSRDAAALPTGNGIGLSITKRIVEQHGGSIDIESTTGAGTRVHIRLPLPD
ncbi:MAG TPA: ATP-binding protein [Candidatus Paceibacterota bacterium]|nr:ATP-binding protein [Candidatus Paceibacterota bacterium]